jgi:hypothetical protein
MPLSRPVQVSYPHVDHSRSEGSGAGVSARWTRDRITDSATVTNRNALSAPRGGCLDHNEVDLLAQKVLSELARDAEKDTAKSHSYKKAA